jgi:uncharacterized phiE125 gp8 family phage protein
MEQNGHYKHFNSLVSLADCRALLGIDEREDALLTFLLEAAARAFEDFCRRRLRYGRVIENFYGTRESCFFLREYPVRSIAGVYVTPSGDGEAYELSNGDIQLDPTSPQNWTAAVRLNLGAYRGLNTIKIIYFAGYKSGDVPPDLKSAVLEAVAWMYARHKAKKVGVTGGTEQYESALPENVRLLLQPYRRVMI